MKRNLKKSLALLLAVIMSVSCFSICGFAAVNDHAQCWKTTYAAQDAVGCKDGKTEGLYCNACGVWIVESKTVPAPHNPGEWVYSDTEDCTKGTRTKTCKTCGVPVKTENVTAHDYETTKKEQTYCDVEGVESKACKNCKKTTTETIPTKLHSWGENAELGWEVKIPASCGDDGAETRSCANCQRVEERVIKSSGHKSVIVDAGKAPTCEKEGSTRKVICQTCKVVLEESQTLSKLKHKDVDKDSYCDNCEGYIGENGDVCTCPCHLKSGILKVLYEIVIFFMQLFKTGQTCACGAAHYDAD